jgi:hypothetical protein
MRPPGIDSWAFGAELRLVDRRILGALLAARSRLPALDLSQPSRCTGPGHHVRSGLAGRRRRAGTAVAFAGLPWSMGLFVGAMTGLVVGMLVESRRRPA